MVLTNKQQFLRRHDLPIDESLSPLQMSELSGFPVEALLEVYKRGVGAWKGNLASVRLKGSYAKNSNTKQYPRGARVGKEQWAAGRVYAFLNRTDTVFYGADNDIRLRYALS